MPKPVIPRETWAVDHSLQVLAQTESRPGPLTDQADLPTNDDLRDHHKPRI